MAREKSPKQTPFGDWLDAHSKTRAWAADELKVSRQYVDKLCRGANAPSLAVALRIEELTKETKDGPSSVPASSWHKLAKPKRS